MITPNTITTMQAYAFSLRRCATTVAALTLILGVAQVNGAAPTDAFPTFDNYVKIGAFGTDVTGNEAAFQARNRQATGTVGIEDMFFAKDLNKDVSLQIDGHALAITNDYLAKFLVTKNDVGSIEMGYKSFRTYYDGVGGFFPMNNYWSTLSPQDLHVDRNKFWVEAKINLPNAPVFTVRYMNETRSGQKDSTIWGSSDYTGLSILGAPITDYRKMAPSYLNLDERHQTFEVTAAHTIGNTSLNAVLTAETVNNLDSRYVTNFPGEVIPWSIASLPTASQPAAKALVSPANWNNQAVTVQTDGINGNTFTARANSVTTFTDKIKLLAGVSYQNINNDFSGSRPISTSTPTAVGVVVATPNTNLNLLGNSDGDIYTGSLALQFNPTPNWSATVSMRGEDSYIKSAATLTNLAAAVNTTTGVVTYTSTNQQEFSRVKEDVWTPVLDLNYTGFANVSIYGSASNASTSGNKYYATPFTAGTTPANSALQFEDANDKHAYYNLGANWRQSGFLTLRGEVFYKDSTISAPGYGIDIANYYNLASQFNGVKLTAIVKPMETVTSTTRFIYQKGKMQVTGLQPTFPEYDSCDAENDSLSETVDWTPNTQFYLQANVNVVFNYINTVYPRAGSVAAAGATPAWDVNQVLQNANNNYITGSLLAGTVLTKTDDLLLKFTYYKADNNDSKLAPITLPYGADAEESVVSVGVKHKFSQTCVGEAKVGYMDSKNVTTGGNTNFRGPMGYVSCTFAL